MQIIEDYKPYLPIISKSRLFDKIPEESYPIVFHYLKASIRQYEKNELLLRLGEPLTHSGIVLDGTVEGSFISENYNKINMNHFPAGHSFAEALACANTIHSPIQLRALTNCTVLFLNLAAILEDCSSETCHCHYQQQLSINLIHILASQNVFSNLKLRIANQKILRDRILIYLNSLVPDKEGKLHVPFSQTALAEFLGVNRSALSRELGHMQDEGMIIADGKTLQLVK